MLARCPDDCLRNIHERDPQIRAWVQVDPQPPLKEGPLSGLCFGAKDVFETAGLRTEFGSPIYGGRQGDGEAAVIGELRRLGATLLGKTTTAAFAYFDPPETDNPRYPGHTPGGSSSGSAAAVAAGMAGFALGTQTMGSVVRPAAFCGVTGFKPTFGLLPTDGVLPFAPSLDTVGLFTETPADMLDLWQRWRGSRGGSIVRNMEAWDCEPAAIRHLAGAGFKIREMTAPQWWRDAGDAARIVNDYEGARTHSGRYDRFGLRIGTKLAQLVERGLAIPKAEYESALERISAARAHVTGAVVTPATLGPPPLLSENSTGDPWWNAPWTALGVPVIAIPIATVPTGIQLAMPWNHENDLLRTAAAISS